MAGVVIRSARELLPGTGRCLHETNAKWHWNCPRCGMHLVAYWGDGVTPEGIQAQPYCGVCQGPVKALGDLLWSAGAVVAYWHALPDHRKPSRFCDCRGPCQPFRHAFLVRPVSS